MKKILLLAASALVVLASCSNNDSESAQNEISFKAINYKNSKAAINNATYPNDIPFGVYAYYLQTGNWEEAGVSSSQYMKDVKVSFDADIYKPAIKYYWPNQGTLTFIAYSPETARASYVISDKKLTITDYSCESVVDGNFADQKDLMYSKASDAKDETANDTQYNGGATQGVQIKFRHALSQLRFFAKPAEQSSTTQFIVTKIEIKDIVNKGTFTVTNDVIDGWTNDNETKENFVTYDNGTGISLPYNVAPAYTRIGDDNSNLLVIPQKFSDTNCKIYVTYKMLVNGTIDAGEKTKNVAIKGLLGENGFEPNKIYNMNFSISADEILFAPEIVNWDASAVDSGEGEL